MAADEAAVGLKLGLTRAPGADATAEPFQVLPLTGEPREEVFVLGELDLESALAGAGPGGEDVQDKGGAVDDLDLEPVFKHSLLGGRKLVVNYDGAVVEFTFESLDLFDLAFAEVGLDGPGELLGNDSHHLCAGAFGELVKFVKGVLEAPQAVGALDG